ncbi:hypothetical protein TNCV_372131 [Trichonephila clavipes]|nr:hypothetical protein TNCV_372131 [Trichonephila clavipes]
MFIKLIDLTSGGHGVSRHNIQVPPAQHARYLCVVCQRFNVIVPDGPRICPNCRQNEDEDLNPMVEREQIQ